MPRIRRPTTRAPRAACNCYRTIVYDRQIKAAHSNFCRGLRGRCAPKIGRVQFSKCADYAMALTALSVTHHPGQRNWIHRM